MAAANIDRFNEVTGAVFAHLYQSFPTPTDVGSAVIGISTPDFVTTDRVNEIQYGGFDSLTLDEQQKVAFLFDTAMWLAKAGFIRFESKGRYELHYVTLTLEGLDLLQAIPKSLGPSLGDQLVDAAKSGVTGKLKELTSELISKAVVLGVKAATDYATS